MGNSVRFKASMDDQVSGKLDKIRDNFDRLGKSKGAQSILQGVGVGVGVSAFGMLSSAIGKATDFLVESVKAAADEEAGIAKLNASLAANVEGWESQTVAIEQAIEAGEAKAFSDDAVRASLARLVGSTHDVAEANRILATAMDLARFKGISLEEASTALIKVEGGQYRALKELGIVLEKGADSTEALATVQKVAAGQAKAYTETLAGQTEILENRWDNLQETIGTALIPRLSDLARLTIGLSDTLDDMNEGGREGEDAFVGFAEAAMSLTFGAEKTAEMMAVLRAEIDKERDASDAASASWDTATETNAALRSSLRKTAETSNHTSDAMRTDARTVKRSYADTADYLLNRYTASMDTAYGIVEARADLNNAKTDEDRAQAYADLAELGALSQKGFDDWITTMERMAKGAKRNFKASVEEAIRYIRALKAEANGKFTISVTYRGDAVRGAGAPQAQSMGGYVEPGRTYTVGEAGKETLVMSSTGGGYVIPNATGGGSSGSGSPVVVQLNLDGREVARVVDKHLYYEAARAPRSSYAG